MNIVYTHVKIPPHGGTVITTHHTLNIQLQSHLVLAGDFEVRTQIRFQRTYTYTAVIISHY